MRVYQLAIDLNTNSTDLLAELASWGFPLRSASSELDPRLEQRLRKFAADNPLPPRLTPHPTLGVPGPRERPRSTSRSSSPMPSHANQRPIVPTAGMENVEYQKTRLEDGRAIRDHYVPTNAIVHAMRDRRRPPYRAVFLDYVGAEDRWAWCGARIKVILPDLFDQGALRTCPDCIAALEADNLKRAAWRSG